MSLTLATLLGVFEAYISTGVTSNAAWDLIKYGYERATDKEWEALFVDALRTGLQEERPRLEAYKGAEDDEVRLADDALHKALNHKLVTPITLASESELTSPDFNRRLAAALAEEEALIIGGFSRSPQDYEALISRVISVAQLRFAEDVRRNETAFRNAVLLAAGENRALLAQVKRDLDNNFHITLLGLDALRAGQGAIHSDLTGLRQEFRNFRDAPQRPAQPAPLRTRVPEPRTRKFVGREADLAWTRRRLLAGDVAAIAAVRGIGGMGKTELAIAAVAALSDHFEGRVVWIDCGPEEIVGIQERIAYALGVKLESGDLAIRADVLDLAWRAQPPILLVLDDVRRRHLADLPRLLPPRPPCAVLITSRRTDVLPHDPEAVRRLGQLEPDEARALFATYLSAAQLDAEPQALAEIIELLERIPLALTLAARQAARIGGRRGAAGRQPLAHLLDELQQRRLQVLHQDEDRPDLSVVITFDISYDDLSVDDQLRLCRLSVLARNEFDLAVAQGVWEIDERAAHAALRRLDTAGLVEEGEETDTWWLHDLLRDYAGERLMLQGEAAVRAARLGHARYWMQWLDDTERLSIPDWLLLDRNRVEIEKALGWLLPNWTVEPVLAAEFAVSLGESFQSHQIATWHQWLEYGIAAATAADQPNALRRLQRGLAAYHVHNGQIDEARKLLDASLATAREILANAMTEDDEEAGQRGVAVTLGDIARLKAQGGDVAGALALHQERLTIFEGLGDVRERAVTLGDIARLKAQGGDVAGALALHQEMLTIFEGLGDVRSRAVTLGDIARLKAQGGDVAGALALHQEEMKVYEGLGDVRERALTLGDIARLKAQGGDVAGALALHQERLTIFEGLGDVRSRAVTQYDLAQLLTAQGNYAEAERLYREVLATSSAIRDVLGVGASRLALGRTHHLQNQPTQARHQLTRAFAGFAAIGLTDWMLHAQQATLEAGLFDSALIQLGVLLHWHHSGRADLGQAIWQQCDLLARAGGDIAAAAGALRSVLFGADAASAPANLPDHLRRPLQAALNGDTHAAVAPPENTDE